jgi:hypothetical protein
MTSMRVGRGRGGGDIEATDLSIMVSGAGQSLVKIAHVSKLAFPTSELLRVWSRISQCVDFLPPASR